MTTTLSTTINQGITLTAAGNYQSPFTITSTGDVATGMASPYGVFSSVTSATLVNMGLIDTGNYAATGVDLTNGGSVLNGLGSKIIGTMTGVNIRGNAPVTGDITNYGTIAGSGNYGVEIFDTGTLFNIGTAALITGALGANLDAGGGTIIVKNTGTILGTISNGIELDSPGTITNTGLIKGAQVGINTGFGGPGTVINAGTIVGSNYAINFGNYANSQLIVDPGAVFTGKVVGTGPGNVLALGAGTGAISGITGSGTSAEFNGFQTIAFDTGAAWTASGNYTGLKGEVVNGFNIGDTLVLDSFVATSDTYVTGTGLELSNGGQSITLDITGQFITSDFSVTNAGSVTAITLDATTQACFVKGTRILTLRGEITVEALQVGDQVVLDNGQLAPVTWIGYRAIDIANHPRPQTVHPVSIMAGALGDGVPARDLYLSLDHALYFDGHLIPVKALVNGLTIRQVERRAVIYYHVELAEHAVLYAEGTPCESYLDTGNRGAFAKAGETIILHPDFAETLRERAGCAPLVESGPVVEAVRARLGARVATVSDAQAAQAGHRLARREQLASNETAFG